MYKEIERCRICGNTNLVPIFQLGNQYLTGVFPKNVKDHVTCGPVDLIKCQEDKEGKFCGLVQLKQSYDLNEMYGLNYGYRSGLNQSMVDHLHGKVKKILNFISLKAGDIVIDIGSNDSTLLQGYPNSGLELTGIDPTGKKFKDYYPKHIKLIPDFFSAQNFRKAYGNKKAKVVTSISMFYDIEDPTAFMGQIAEILDDNGVWVFEQSYMPTMLERNAYDTICHEHLEYYRFKQIKWMADKVGLKVLDVEFNNVNGGSFSIMVAKSGAEFKENKKLIDEILADEERKGLGSLKPYEEFVARIRQHKEEFCRFLKDLKASNKKVIGYGASTKGNVILQYCQLTPKDLPYIAEVNVDKFGCFTPGTLIPIISEKEARAMKPDYMIAFPWHFKEGFIKREKEYLEGSGALVFPLPEVEVIKGAVNS